MLVKIARVQTKVADHKFHFGGTKVLFNITDGGVTGSTSRSELKVYEFTSGVSYIRE